MNRSYFDKSHIPVLDKFELGNGLTKTEWEASQKAIQEEQARLGAAYNRLRAHPALKGFPRGSVVSGNLIPLLIHRVRQAAFPLPQSVTLPLALDSLTSTENAERAGFAALKEIAVPLLKAQYKQEINQWDWLDICKVSALYPIDDEDNEGRIGHCFLGTVFDLNPSGKYWTCWAANNVDDDESLADIAFNEALEEVAEGYDGWIEAGEDDPCDIFFEKRID